MLIDNKQVQYPTDCWRSLVSLSHKKRPRLPGGKRGLLLAILFACSISWDLPVGKPHFVRFLSIMPIYIRPKK
jgi:hypothetical protein